MRGLIIKISLIVLLIILSFNLAGCQNNAKDGTFGFEQFKREMKAHDYKFKIQDVGQDFLPTTRKRMLIGTEAIEIYIYESNESMENDAGRIDSGGCTYSGVDAKKVSWASIPHFHKKGNIIVQYTGKNNEIKSDLVEILGNQFAGG